MTRSGLPQPLPAYQRVTLLALVRGATTARDVARLTDVVSARAMRRLDTLIEQGLATRLSCGTYWATPAGLQRWRAEERRVS